MVVEEEDGVTTTVSWRVHRRAKEGSTGWAGGSLQALDLEEYIYIWA